MRDPVEAMDHRIIFFGLLIGIGVFALWRGGAPERIAAVAMLVATPLSVLMVRSFADRFRSLEAGVLAVDVVMFALFLGLAITAERYWPIWMTGLQGAAITSHLPTMLLHEPLRLAYAILLALWSYPIVILLAIGTVRHRRRLRRYGADPSWRRFSVPWRRTGPRPGPER